MIGISPLAGVYYWTKSSRTEQMQVKMVTSDDEKRLKGMATEASSAAVALPDKMDSSKLVAETVDGVAGEIPVIAYTEKVLAEKEATLRKIIQDNYAKIQAVEKELEALHLEVKLTSGSKKAGMELLRQKIEQSTEKARLLRKKEEQAKKVWEAAAKLVEEEEQKKQQLCDDLRMMVQQNALQQYERLEALTHKLDALNPEMRGPALEAIQGLRAKIAPHGVLPVYVSRSALLLPSFPHQLALYPSISAQGREAPASAQGTCAPSAAPADAANSTAPASIADAPATTPKAQGAEGDAQSQGQEGSSGAAAAAAANGGKGADGGGAPAARLSISRGRGRGRGRGLIAKGGNKAGGDGQWTGAGFDVEDESIA
ncbi:unnamed protein product [Closterium sp. Naga37s-1]|nr:unnamed protein product [Closterium sp. Naga37s-1]